MPHELMGLSIGAVGVGTTIRDGGEGPGALGRVKVVPFLETGRTTELAGRQEERGVLDRLAAAVRGGESQALVVHGAPGVGKSALLEYLARRARDFRVARTAGVRPDMELAFAAVHQLCVPIMDHLSRLPEPQRNALEAVFGMSPGPTPDPVAVGVAVLRLLYEAAREQPLLCLVDDQQWLDQASAQVLAFVARKLGAGRLGIVFGTRARGGDLEGLPELAVEGLDDADARLLLEAASTGPIEKQVRDQIIAEAQGNPQALLELPRSLTAAGPMGEFGLPGALRPHDGVREVFLQRVGALPTGTRRLLLIVAADPAGDPALVWQAAGQLGIGADQAGPAVGAGLAEFGKRVRFRHPLVRRVIYASASAAEKREVHGALAESIDPQIDPDRRAWHRALAAPWPDDDVAAELELSASSAKARAGLSAAASLLERATMLTRDPAQRAARALDAARAKIEAGAFESARDLLGVAAAGPLSEMEQARAGLLRARLTAVRSRAADAPFQLVEAARRVEPFDAAHAQMAYLEAFAAAMLAGRLAAPGSHSRDVARAVTAAWQFPQARPRLEPLLTGLAANFTDGYLAGVPALRQALAAYSDGEPSHEDIQRLWLANMAALHLWDDDLWDSLSTRYLRLARMAGSVGYLPLALCTRSYFLLFSGELNAAASLTDEGHRASEATGSNIALYSALNLAALRGRKSEVSTLAEAATRDAEFRGKGWGQAIIEWSNAVLNNGLGHYREAAAAATAALRHQEYPDTRYPGAASWAATELVEAGVRTGMSEAACGAYRWLAAATSDSRTDWALGVQARSLALLSAGDAAESLYREAVTRLSRSRARPELARAHLLYGEWLRRERRRAEARDQLRTARRMLEVMGMAAFADRARRELLATGETARKRGGTADDRQLTAQETQVARLARDGMSNPEIAALLFLSPRTVQYHLGNVFAKLGISSRDQLSRMLPDEPPQAGQTRG